MDSMTLLGRVIPIFLLFLLGFILKKTSFIEAATASGMKKLVVNITLPTLLFRVFSNMEFGRDEILLAVMIFCICCVLLLILGALTRYLLRRNDIRTYMLGGFEAGMLGYALFLSVFGNEALPVFASVDLGQVLFVFLILMPILLGRARGQAQEAAAPVAAALNGMVRSPVVWAILGGLVSGLIGKWVSPPPQILAPAGRFLETLGNLTVPIIALSIGYELSFKRRILLKAIIFIAVRKAALLALALGLTRIFMQWEHLKTMAFLTMFILPPPFVVALAAEDDERELVAGILSLDTVATIPVFALIVFLFA